MNAAPYELPAHNWLTEPELLFHPEHADQTDIHPLKGLHKFGPFSQASISQVLDPLRVAFIVAHGHTQLARELVVELERKADPRERRPYLIDFPGFSRVFGVRVVAAPQGCHIELDPTLDGAIASANSPHLVLAESITRALSSLGSPCATPWALMRRSPGARLELEVEFQDGRKHLPLVTIRPAA